MFEPEPSPTTGAPTTYHLVDVSMGMDDFVFPGDDPVTVDGPFDVVGTENPEWVYRFTSPTQAGTHIQGPHYFLRDGAHIDAFPLERFEGWAHIVDVETNGIDTGPEALADQLPDEIEDQFVILRSGHMDALIRGQALEAGSRPGLSLEAARWLIDQGVTLVAIDSVGVESRVTKNFDVNVLLCQHEVLILEGLVGLADVGNSSVWLEAFPLKLEGVEGTPCRAVLKVPV